MFCIQCRHPRTAVTNSRPHKKLPIVWRRRSCAACGNVFTTIEKPDLISRQVRSSGQTQPFNLGRLIISIANAFQHNPALGTEHAAALADTILGHLTAHQDISTATIAEEAHRVLSRFDESAGMAYALQHGLSIKKQRSR
jgi:transcriptional repressor NrdR